MGAFDRFIYLKCACGCVWGPQHEVSSFNHGVEHLHFTAWKVSV